MQFFPQDGSPLTYEQWLSLWPVSKKSNEWVRAFGLTYTLVEDMVGQAVRVVVVGPGGVRREVYLPGFNTRDAKDWLWVGAESRPLTLDELNFAGDDQWP